MTPKDKTGLGMGDQEEQAAESEDRQSCPLGQVQAGSKPKGCRLILKEQHSLAVCVKKSK